MFRFTIRDLLWLTVLVAAGVGWLIDRQALARRATDSESELVQAKDKIWTLETRMDQVMESYGMVHRQQEFYRNELNKVKSAESANQNSK